MANVSSPTTFCASRTTTALAQPFAMPAAAMKKGNVEKKVGYHRTNMLVPVPEIDDLKAFNRRLLAMCDQDMQRHHYLKGKFISELFKEDLKALLPLPRVSYDCSKLVRVRNKQIRQICS